MLLDIFASALLLSPWLVASRISFGAIRESVARFRSSPWATPPLDSTATISRCVLPFPCLSPDRSRDSEEGADPS